MKWKTFAPKVAPLGGAFAFVLALAAPSMAGKLGITDLSCDYAVQPLGIEDLHPRLGWRLQSPARGQVQSAYQIQVSSREDLAESGVADLWDTGKVTSDQSIQVAYGGLPLSSRQRCFWRVRVWDGTGEPCEFSPVRSWEMGLLSPAEWTADWIGYTAGWQGRALYFRHRFEVRKPLRRARAYIAGLGYYELRINGAKVGDHVLDPGWTDYAKRVLYVTYDLGADLQPGDNTVGVIAGQGWYGTPKIRLQIELTYADGGRETIASEGGSTHVPDVWQVSGGPILRNGVYDGETYDARLERPGWDLRSAPPPAASPGRLEEWTTAVPVDGPSGKLMPQTIEPIRVVESFTPAGLARPHPGVYVFDAGQNLAGWAQLRIAGPRGTKITLRFAENLNPDGAVNQDNLRTAAATDEYVLKGGGREVWEPRFTYHGFRYVQLEGCPAPPTLDTLRIRRVRSDVADNGTFACGDDLLNRIQRMVRATEASNLHSVPTDCPQRNERMGWLNDMTVRAEEAIYNFSLARFYGKWIDDIADTQDAAGAIADTAPFKWGKRPADPVCASYFLLAWLSYVHYGDVRIIRDHYESFSRWAEYLLSRSDHGIVPFSSWGDWSPPEAFAIAGSNGSGAVSAYTPGDLMSTGSLYYQIGLLSRMASVLGRPDEAGHWDKLAREVGDAFNRKYWNEAAGGYGSNNQACNSFALYIGVVPPERKARTTASLIRAVERNGGYLSTGNLCTKFLLETLSTGGRPDIAHEITDKRAYPSWGNMLDNGATTLWERWENLIGGGMNSHNHPMMGSVSSWFFKYLGGIQADPEAPGFKHFFIRPGIVDQVGWAEASYLSPYGRIRSSWRKDAGGLTMKVSVPVNSTATVYIPGAGATEGGLPADRAPGVKFLRPEAGCAVYEVGSGDYVFASAPVATLLVPADDRRIRYMGRWEHKPGRATTVNSGSAILFRFQGRRLHGRFEVKGIATPAQIYVAIDGGDKIALTVGAPDLNLAPTGLAEGEHTVLLEVKDVSQDADRWAPPLRSGLIFDGFALEPQGGPLDPGPALVGRWSASAPRLIFFGDSITQGVRIHSMATGAEGADGTMTYAYLTALAFKANLVQVGFGGQGVTTAGWGKVPPAAESLDWNFAGSPADPGRADVVVVNQGTNDRHATSEVFAADYSAYLRRLRALYPSALIFALRPFNGDRAEAIRAAVARLGDPRVRYVDTAGWVSPANPRNYTEHPVGLHPTASGHAEAARRLIAVLRAAGVGR